MDPPFKGNVLVGLNHSTCRSDLFAVGVHQGCLYLILISITDHLISTISDWFPGAQFGDYNLTDLNKHRQSDTVQLLRGWVGLDWILRLFHKETRRLGLRGKAWSGGSSNWGTQVTTPTYSPSSFTATLSSSLSYIWAQKFPTSPTSLRRQ